MNHLYNALKEIESLLLFPPLSKTNREMKIYSIACAALNLADGMTTKSAETPDLREQLTVMGERREKLQAAISALSPKDSGQRAAEPEQQQAGGE